MRMHKFFFVGMAMLVAATACDDSNSGASCPAGAANCPCFPNATCNAGLQCTNNVCVAASNPGAGGSSSTATGQGGSSTATGDGGTTATGNGGTTTTSSTSATGGAPACTNTTDPNNCGSCGHVCKSGKCVNGACAPKFSACFTRPAGYSNCNAACAAEGQSCVAEGCMNGYTYLGWNSETSCNQATTSVLRMDTACDATFEWGSMTHARCCCTDN